MTHTDTARWNDALLTQGGGRARSASVVTVVGSLWPAGRWAVCAPLVLRGKDPVPSLPGTVAVGLSRCLVTQRLSRTEKYVSNPEQIKVLPNTER